MTDDLDSRLATRFERQDDPALHRDVAFELVRERAGQIERRRQRRRRLVVLAVVVVAVLVTVPAIAVSHTLVERFFGQPADPGLRDYIGRVLQARPGSSFATPPRYVAGVRTPRGLVLLWAARREDGTRCMGIQAAFGDADVIRLELAGRTIADNGITCGMGLPRLDSANAGLANGQGLGSVHVMYGEVPSRVRAVRLTFEDGRTQTATAEHGWVIVALEQGAHQPGHRPILEQALDKRDHPIATERLNPWDYGGTEPPPPKLGGPGSRLLATVPTAAGPAQLRVSAPGLGWQRQQCWGLILGGRSAPILCGYPASTDLSSKAPRTTNLFLYGPRFPGVVIAMATTIDHAWLVAADHSVRPARTVRFALGRHPQIVIVAGTGSGPRALTGIVTSRNRRIVGALLMASAQGVAPGGATPPCFLTDNGHAPTTPACQALMATARRAATSELR